MSKTLEAIKRAWDFITLEFLLKILAISLILSLGLIGYNTIQVRNISEDYGVLARDNRKTLEIIESQTSPEAIARQKAQVEDIIGIIDCNQRQALQDALQGLVDRGILSPKDVVTITRACELREDPEVTTTTTTTTTIPQGPGAED